MQCKFCKMNVSHPTIETVHGWICPCCKQLNDWADFPRDFMDKMIADWDMEGNTMLQKGKINFLVGACWGSEGKGNVAAYIAKTKKIDINISNNGPNAGHQFIDDDGNVQTMKMLPVGGVVAKNSIIILGPGSVIDIERLMLEITANPGVEDRLLISPTAVIVDDYCREYEKEHLQYIASTFQGTGAAIGLKAMRSQKVKLAKDIPPLKRYLSTNIPETIMDACNAGQTILCEISQGIHLSIDSEFYPYCTSRPINVGQSLAYLDVPPSLVGNVIGIARTYPIRVGNVPNGVSGGVYPDSEEITWEQLSEHINRPVKELTTVTKRVRRVFTFSKIAFEKSVRRNNINIMFISFADYLLKHEKIALCEYLVDKHKFDKILFVNGFGNFESNIEEMHMVYDLNDKVIKYNLPSLGADDVE